MLKSRRSIIQLLKIHNKTQTFPEEKEQNAIELSGEIKIDC